MHGTVHGGNQPVTGAQVTAYAAGDSTSATLTSATALACVQTDSSGNFSFGIGTASAACNGSALPTNFVCGTNCAWANSQIYLIASGGNPGLAAGTNNTALALMAALGPYASLPPSVDISELTTMASAYALGSSASSGGLTINGTSPWLVNSFSAVGTLANVSSASPGTALPAASGCSGSSSAGCVALQKLYTLADALAACVNTTAAGSTACQQLFCDATPGSNGSCAAAPSIANTLEAALSITQNPAAVWSPGLYGFASKQSPFLPTVTAAPADWSMTPSGLWTTVYYPAYGNLTLAQTPFGSMSHVVNFSLVPAHTLQTGGTYPACSGGSAGDPCTRTAGTPGKLTDPFGVLGNSAAFVAAAHAAGAKALLGIGGDLSVAASQGFEDSTKTSALATTLANNIVADMAMYGYDGVDIDWESIGFPSASWGGAPQTAAYAYGNSGGYFEPPGSSNDPGSPFNDVAQFRTFIAALRTALNNQSTTAHYLLTFPAGTASSYDGGAAYAPGYSSYANYALLVNPVAGDIDQVNLQTYGMGADAPGWGTWYGSPLHSDCDFPGGSTTPLPSIDSVVQDFISPSIGNVPAAKVGIGIQLVGVDWFDTDGDYGGGNRTNGGPSTPCQALPTDAGDGAPYEGQNQINLGDLFTSDVTPTYSTASTNDAGEGGYTPTYDSAAGVPYLSDATTGDFISYENTRSIQAKAQYLQSKGLGGIIVFEASQDYMSGNTAGDPQHPLLAALRQQVLQRP